MHLNASPLRVEPDLRLCSAGCQARPATNPEWRPNRALEPTAHLEENGNALRLSASR